MKRPPFKWTDFALMFVGAVTAAVIYVLITGDADAEGPYVVSIIGAGAALGALPLAYRIKRRDEAEEAAQASAAQAEMDEPA